MGDGRRARRARADIRRALRSIAWPADAARSLLTAGSRSSLAHRCARLSRRSRSICALEMRGERVERLLDTGLVGEAEAVAPSRASQAARWPVVGEQAVDVGAGDAAVRRDGAVGAAVGEAQRTAARVSGPVVTPICIS